MAAERFPGTRIVDRSPDARGHVVAESRTPEEALRARPPGGPVG